MLPWIFKLFYGAMSDTIPIFGSRKRWWMIIMGLIQFCSLYYAATGKIKDVETMTFYLTFSTLAGAFMDVIVDGLMVMQAKRDPLNGTQDLVTYHMIIQGTASICGGMFGAYYT
jgi:hypothetical protein